MCAPDFAAPPPEHTADAGYDIHEDAALIAQSIAKQYLELPSLARQHNYREETRKGVAVEYVPNALPA